MTELHDDLIVTDVPGIGRVAYIGPAIPDDAPATIREGLTRRRLVSIHGTCPCGSRLVRPNRAERRAAKRAGRIPRGHVEHENDCPAVDQTLRSALAAAGYSPGTNP
jgi:hypothetical protein